MKIIFETEYNNTSSSGFNTNPLQANEDGVRRDFNIKEFTAWMQHLAKGDIAIRDKKGVVITASRVKITVELE